MNPHLQQILHEITVRLTKLEETFAQPKNDCTRSHPHEEMSKECELRTEIARLRNQLAQPEQGPVGVFQQDDDIGYVRLVAHQQAALKDGDKLYTTPPQRTWVGLSDEEMYKLWLTVDEETDRMAFGKAVEAKLKEKNSIKE